MQDDAPPGDRRGKEAERQQQRLAEALRANLRRRKTAARNEAGDPPAGDEDASENRS